MVQHGVPPARKQWQRLALAAMRRTGRAGDDTTEADVERLLATTTYDGITVPALHTEAPASMGVPGAFPFTRGVSADPPPWQVRQRRTPGMPLAPETDAVWLSWDGDGVDALAQLPLQRVAVALDAGAATERAAEALFAAAERQGVPQGELRGNLGAGAGLTRLAPLCAQHYPGLRAATVDTLGYHEAGGSDVDIIACATATGIDYLRRLTGAGLGVRQALGQLEFRYAATADQFATIALLRAARRVWSRVAEECGAAADGAQQQHAVTSPVMMTGRDPAGNILRATVACFAAVAGGAAAVTVLPPAAGEAADRLARNIHAVLRDEANLHRVADPAGGSWYVERLTEELASRAWERFREIERAGGMAAALDSGMIAARLDATWRRRQDDLARRRVSIVGVSRFADPGEEGATGNDLPVRRNSGVFEALRDRVDAHTAATGQRPTVRLLPLGLPADRAARVDFAAELFAAAGIVTVVDAGHRPDAPVVCLCGPDSAYAQGAEPAARAAAADGAVRVWLAGRPAGHAGVTGYLFEGADVLDILETTLKDLGVG